MNKTSVVLVALAVIVIIYVGITYNQLITANEAIDSQWAQVETQYQRRIDLIPNLVESVKGVMSQEQKIFGELADARTRYATANTTDQKVAAATQVDSTLSRLLVIMENYPQLKSADTVQTLMSQLEGTENRVSVERKRYNDAIQNFNTRIKHIPTAWIAATFNFSERNYLEATNGAEKAPKVNL